jgi:putative hydrolase of the HAD superfamily
MTETRAVIFDLDDTLYPSRRFTLSGFCAVARQIERDHGIPAPSSFRVMRRAWGSVARGRELQAVCETFGLPLSLVSTWVTLIRQHTPRLRLPAVSRDVLSLLRREWRIGILTNGLPDVQARKVAALGLAPLVDAVVFAAACGDGRGKPAPEGFDDILARLRTPAASAVFVGNDPVADVGGAAGVGMKTIHLRDRYAECVDATGRTECQATVTRLLDVPAVASRLVESLEYAHAI